jgi:hypothetical protein
VPGLGRAAALALLVVSLALAPAASAARLVGGARQQAIEHAFRARHAGRLIVSVRVSSARPAWSLVRWVRPGADARGGRRAPDGRGERVRAHSAYFRRAGQAERPGRPPHAARADLSRPLHVIVTYRGRGREAIRYRRRDPGVCDGLGGFVDTERVRVAPMRWVVRYRIDLDQLRAAVRGPDGPAIVPRVTLLRGRSSVRAVETLRRSSVDHTCAGPTTRFECRRVARLDPSDPLLSIRAHGGLEIGVPARVRGRGQCSGADYPLGPSRWDGGAATVAVPTLGIAGGRLPARPYRPVAVRWPVAAAGAAFRPGPCTATKGCRDAFAWRGSVTLRTN